MPKVSLLACLLAHCYVFVAQTNGFWHACRATRDGQYLLSLSPLLASCLATLVTKKALCSLPRPPFPCRLEHLCKLRRPFLCHECGTQCQPVCHAGTSPLYVFAGLSTFCCLLLEFLTKDVCSCITCICNCPTSLGVICKPVDAAHSCRAQHAAVFTGSVPTTNGNIEGAASLILWTLTAIVVVKYALIVLLADDNGLGTPSAAACARTQPGKLGPCNVRAPRAWT